ILKDGYARSYMLGKGSKFLSYQLYSSEAILLELQDRLENKFGFERSGAVRVIADIRQVISIVHPKLKLTVVHDSDDDKIIECALEAGADLIISFDQDLIAVKEYAGVKIVHPSTLKYFFPK